MTVLLLARHGETVDNVNRIMQGQTQGELTANGVLQAKNLGLQLKSDDIDVIVSSDLRRSYDTAMIIAEILNKDVTKTTLLRERDWGGFTGRYIPDIQNETWPDDIETLEALQGRARKFLDYISTTYHDKCVLAVGHGIINKAIQAVFYNKPMKDVERMTNAEVRKLVIE